MYYQHDVTDRQTDKQTDRQTDRQTERKACQVSPQPLIQQIADDRTLLRAYTWLRAQHPGALPPWDYFKSSLPQKLLSGEYCFQPVTLATTTNRFGEPERQEVWHAPDQLVLKAISLVLDLPRPNPPRTQGGSGSPRVRGARGVFHHLDGHAGIKQTLRQTRDYLHNHPDSWVMSSDVKGYYTNLDHSILYQQLQDLFPQETYLLRLLWQSLKRTVAVDGHYEDIERGISLGSPLSPLMAALYLKPLDDYFAGTTPNPSSPRRGTDFSPPYQGGAGGGFFYARFMDDWVILAPTRWQLRSAVAQSNRLLEQLQLRQAPDTPFLGGRRAGLTFWAIT